MAKIIVSHEKSQKERWRPFDKDRRDIQRIIEDIWISVEDTDPYNIFRGEFGYIPSCSCDYPPETRPIATEQFKSYHGCLLDLDAYIEGLDYLKDEVNSLKFVQKVFAGCISKVNNKLPGEEEFWYNKPIKNEGDLKKYLEVLITWQMFSLLLSKYEKMEDQTSADMLVDMWEDMRRRFSSGGY